MLDLEGLLTDAVQRHRVPGASIAVLRDGRIEVAAAGVANVRTGEAATPEHLFNYGSVTKVLTATAVARLVTQGRLELDASVMQYLPGFNPPDDRARQITVRHLLCHTSGLVGTLFHDTGRGADAIPRQIDLIAEQPLYHRPGALVSYCNSALIMLGRLVEVVTGKPWPEAFAEVLTGPLGLETVVTAPEQALRWRHSIGHVATPDRGWAVEQIPFFIPGHSPAGSTPMGRARDLVTLALLYLDQGRGPDGSQFIDPDLVSEMQAFQSRTMLDHYLGFGLGWLIYDYSGRKIIGHDGGTLGSNAFFRVDPEQRFAVALLVNATAGLPLYEEVLGAVFRDSLGVWEAPPPAALPVDESALRPYLGVYGDNLFAHTLLVRDGKLILETLPSGPTPFKIPPHVTELRVAGPGRFFVSGPEAMLFTPEKPAKLDLWRPFSVFEADGDQYLQAMLLSFKKTV